MRSLGLQARILLLTAAGIAAISLLYFLSEAYIQVSNGERRMNEQSRSIGAALVPSLQNDLVVGDLATAQQILDSIMKYEHFDRLAILDAAGDKVLVEGRILDGADTDQVSPAWFSALLKLRHDPIEMPIQAGGIVYGVLVAAPSPKILEDDLWRQLRLMFYLSLFILVVALPLFILTLRSGLKPLRKLAASAQKFGDGDFSRRASESSVREVAQTARAFNRMAGNIENLLGELRASNATIRSMNETLELRVQERTAELEAANQELEAFSYSVSHDLRAPLRALDGYSHLLAEDPQSQIGKDGRHYIERIRASSQRMAQLIEDLLDLARISRHELKHVPVDLSAMANEVRELVEEQAPLRKVAWNIAPGLSASGDPVLLKALLDNLLRNAWKFTSESPDARIEFVLCNVGGGKAFCVRDNGAGFEMAYADKLFKPFQRLHDAKRFEGTGIGLAIVYRILRRHGGKIWAEGSPGLGAAFFFTLP
ncbi:MAG: HAMP domain-containing protein [Rhodocyclales bacterium]|nr:HAMP domain-containing protein [Rhodocyclales bacterium]